MRSRPGIALLLALVVLLFVEVMTAGMLALSTQTRLVTASHIRTARADAVARNTVQSVIATWEPRRFDTLAAGSFITVETRSEADESSSLTLERVQQGAYVLRGRARVGGPLAFSTASAVAVVRSLDRIAVLQDFNAALTSIGATVIAGGSWLTADPTTLPPAWSDALCPPLEPLPAPAALLVAAAPMVGDGVELAGTVTLDSLLALPDSIALGGVKWSELEAIADRVESGSVSPGPTVEGERCDLAAPGNWGDPLRTEPACGDYFPLIYAPGDLRVTGGVGQGILAVAGTLTFSGEATFAGVVVALNGIIIEPNARLFGSVRSEGDVTLIDSADLVYSRCAIARALTLTAAVRRAILQPRTFIPAF